MSLTLGVGFVAPSVPFVLWLEQLVVSEKGI
jgi:hypothetical protein